MVARCRVSPYIYARSVALGDRSVGENGLGNNGCGKRRVCVLSGKKERSKERPMWFCGRFGREKCGCAEQEEIIDRICERIVIPTNAMRTLAYAVLRVLFALGTVTNHDQD